MATIQILDRKTLSNNKYPLQRITFQKPDKDGELHDLENEVYFRPDAVAVLLVDHPKKQLLLTRQFRLPTFLNGSDSGYLVEACAGLIDDDETPEQTARREALEETGYEITDLEQIGAVYSSAGGITEYVHLFLAAYNSNDEHGNGGGLAAEGEDIELITLGFSEAREKLLLAEFRDAKTVMLLQYFFLTQYSHK